MRLLEARRLRMQLIGGESANRRVVPIDGPNRADRGSAMSTRLAAGFGAKVAHGTGGSRGREGSSGIVQGSSDDGDPPDAIRAARGH